MHATHSPAIARSRLPYAILLCTLLFLGGLLNFLVYRFGDTAFGYDTGLYRRYMLDHANAMGETAAPAFGFTRVTTPLLRIGVPIDIIAYGFYTALCLGIVALVYHYLAQIRDPWSGAIGSVLFATSLTWLDFVGWYYYRNLVALFLILLTFILLHRRSSAYIVPLIAIGVIHPISLLPIGFTLMVEVIINRRNRAWLVATGSACVFTIFFIQYRELLQYAPIVTNSLGRAPNLTSMPELTGQFISPAAFLLYAIPHFIFGLIGLWRNRQALSHVFVLSVVAILLIAAQIILYRRLLVVIDLCLAIGAALFLRHWYETFPWPKIRAVLASTYIILLVARSTMFVHGASPLVSLDEVVAMQSIRLGSSTSSLMALTPATTPWLAGFTPYQIIAPGMLDNNRWNETVWQEFWTTTSSDRRAELLSGYTSSSMAIFIGSNDHDIAATLLTDPRIRQRSSYLWDYRVADPATH